MMQKLEVIKRQMAEENGFESYDEYLKDCVEKYIKEKEDEL